MPEGDLRCQFHDVKTLPWVVMSDYLELISVVAVVEVVVVVVVVEILIVVVVVIVAV